MSEFYNQRLEMINNCKNAIDSKTKVPKNREIALLECLTTVEGSTNKCAEVFMENHLIQLKKQGKFLTLKQATKFQKGSKQSQLHILKPIDRDSALYGGYTGNQCTCGSWRIRLTQNMDSLECYDCDRLSPKEYLASCTHCHSLLYKDRLVHIVKTGKCENCNEIVDLPQVLIDYAKL